MKKTIDLLVFDWDGTLIDSIGWIVVCIQRAARDCDCPVPTDVEAKAVIGLGLHEAMTKLFPCSKEATKMVLVQRYREMYASRSISPGDLFPGVADMLISLRENGYRLAVATGKSRAGLQSAMAGTQTAHYFDTTRCADETRSKPHPMMLLEIMQELDVDAGSTLMIGDTVHDLGMAGNAGVQAVAVTCGADQASALSEFNPVFFLQNTVELGRWLGNNARLEAEVSRDRDETPDCLSACRILDY